MKAFTNHVYFSSITDSCLNPWHQLQLILLMLPFVNDSNQQLVNCLEIPIQLWEQTDARLPKTCSTFLLHMMSSLVLAQQHRISLCIQYSLNDATVLGKLQDAIFPEKVTLEQLQVRNKQLELDITQHKLELEKARTKIRVLEQELDVERRRTVT